MGVPQIRAVPDVDTPRAAWRTGLCLRPGSQGPAPHSARVWALQRVRLRRRACVSGWVSLGPLPRGTLRMDPRLLHARHSSHPHPRPDPVLCQGTVCGRQRAVSRALYGPMWGRGPGPGLTQTLKPTQWSLCVPGLGAVTCSQTVGTCPALGLSFPCLLRGDWRQGHPWKLLHRGGHPPATRDSWRRPGSPR